VKDAWTRYHGARLTLATYTRDIVPRTRQSLESARSRYTTGRTAFIDLLDATRSFLDAALKREQAHRDLGRALADLADAVGIGPGRYLRDAGGR
jgi:outer membrane protein TolC